MLRGIRKPLRNNNRLEMNHEGQFRENNWRTINRGKVCTSRKYAQGRDT